MPSKNKKTAAAATAAVLGLAILLTGTFAWQSISQTALNEKDGEGNPGGRLHDDFNGKNKDVYVENFTDPDDENSMPIFARVRLDEYMEIGTGAGNPEAEGRDALTIIGKEGAKLGDKNTWLTHVPGFIDDEAASKAHNELHNYWEWEMGGNTVYMPTFNKDKDSLESDINGTYAGTDGDRTTGTKYDDYVEYKLGDTKEGTAVYSDNMTETETHTATNTKDAKVITMSEWLELPEENQTGDFWVYDVDGWAYWANPIQPGTATGPLLNEITMKNQPDTEWYYAINAVGQFATAGDWGDNDKKTGFYEDGITNNALNLLNKAADIVPQVSYLQVKDGGVKYVKAGSKLTLQADIDIKNSANDENEKNILWSIEPNVPELSNGVFSPTNSMVGKKYTVTATSVYDLSKTATATVYVIPTDSVKAVKGLQDGKTYVEFADNTYKEINLEDGSLGEFVCAGADKIIGNGDDRKDVVLTTSNTQIGIDDPTYGTKLLGPDSDGVYMAMGADKMLGTDDDIKVIKDPTSEDELTPNLADKVTITAKNNATSVKVEKKLQFSAKVTLYGQEVRNQDVTWSVTGKNSADTTIDQNGLLSVGADETVGKNIIVTATYNMAPAVKANYTVTVKPWDFVDIKNVTPGSAKTVTVDGSQWFVLAKDGSKALIMSKGNLAASRAHNGQSWDISKTRTYLNGEWLNSMPILSQKAISTSIYSHTAENDKWVVTNDRVFLLTEADVFGTYRGTPTNDARDYTYGSTPNLYANSEAWHNGFLCYYYTKFWF